MFKQTVSLYNVCITQENMHDKVGVNCYLAVSVNYIIIH